jgi:2-hydroxychromene-2-carboxylate isomerase
MAAIRFCFDFNSPYSYLAWTQIHALAARHARTVEPVPVLLGAILTAMKTRGPAEIPAKRAYLIKDIGRLAALHQVKIAVPPTHPFNSMLALRVASLPAPPELRHRVIDALFHAVWAKGESIEDRVNVARIAKDVGLVDDPLAAAESPEGKACLRAQTDDLVARGGFGVPTIFVEDELFFGFDSLPMIERVLRGEDALDRALVDAWLGVRPSVERRL